MTSTIIEMISEVEDVATKAVDQRIEDYASDHSEVTALRGIFVMGLVTDNREKQIRRYGQYLLSQVAPNERWKEVDPQ